MLLASIRQVWYLSESVLDVDSARTNYFAVFITRTCKLSSVKVTCCLCYSVASVGHAACAHGSDGGRPVSRSTIVRALPPRALRLPQCACAHAKRYRRRALWRR